MCDLKTTIPPDSIDIVGWDPIHTLYDYLINPPAPMLKVKIDNKELLEFLRESNAIEWVYDELSLMDSLAAWNYIMRYKHLTHQRVLALHSILMRNQPIRPKYRGTYRDCPVWIGGKEAPTWQSVPNLLDHWIRQTGRPWQTVKENHILFEHIHPFIDGNGRIGRILMNWEHAKKKHNNGLIIIHRWEEQQSYYQWF